MNYKILELRSKAPDALATEIMYEVATARVAGAQLLRMNIAKGEDDKLNRRLASAVKRTLKAMKEQGRIQFYALPDNFRIFATEAKFLVNKFPDVFEQMPEETEEVTFAYVKI